MNIVCLRQRLLETMGVCVVNSYVMLMGLAITNGSFHGDIYARRAGVEHFMLGTGIAERRVSWRFV